MPAAPNCPCLVLLLSITFVAATQTGFTTRAVHGVTRVSQLTALEKLRAGSSAKAFAAAILARLGRLLQPRRSEAGGDGAEQVERLLGWAAAGPCASGTKPPAIAEETSVLWPEALVHDAALPECQAALAADGRSPPPSLLLMVVSQATTTGAKHRSSVRRTWGSRRGLAVAFFLGSDASIQKEIDAEAKRYRDLVQFRMPEKPDWSTRRHLAALEWALTRCPGTPHLVRVDDTVFVDTVHLTDYLTAGPQPPGFLCSPRRGELPQRARSSPWFISKREFPGERYPDFCRTDAYAITNATALRLLICAVVKRPYIWMDDVFVTGVLREAAGVPLSGFPPGHDLGDLMPSDSGSWGRASNYMFLRSELPAFIDVYWPGMWRSLLKRDCAMALF